MDQSENPEVPEVTKKSGNPNWVKGKSGNPLGRLKRGQTLTDILIEHGESIMVTDKTTQERYSANVAVSKIVWRHALEGNFTFIRFVWERIEGKPIQKIEQITAQVESINIDDIESIELKKQVLMAELKKLADLEIKEQNKKKIDKEN
jgi:hypothetical protein